MKIKKQNSMLAIAANVLFVILYTYIAINVIKNTPIYVSGSIIKYMVMTLIWAGIIFISYQVAIYLERNNLLWRMLIVLLLLFHCVYVWAVYSQVDSDAYVVNYIAYHYVLGDMHVQPFFWTEYLSFYTNNIPITQILVGIYQVWLPKTLESSWLLLSILAAILADITIFYIYKVVSILFNRRAAIVAVLLSIPMINLSESGTIFYTDIIAIWTVPASLYYAIYTQKNLNLPKQKRFALLAITGMVLAFGVWLKPQNIVAVIAIIIVKILGLNRNRNSKKHTNIIVIGAFLLSMCFFLCIKSVGVNIIGRELVDQNSMPVEHFIAMGLNKDSMGGYNEEDVNQTKQILGNSEKKEFLRMKIVNRLQEFGADGLIQHLSNKLLQGVGNGTFTVGRVWRGTPMNNHAWAQKIQNWFITENPGWDSLTAPWIQTEYLIIMIFDILGGIFTIGLIKKGKCMVLYNITTMISIALIGIILFLLILECNMRYLYALMPEMIIMFIYGLENTRILLRKHNSWLLFCKSGVQCKLR